MKFSVKKSGFVEGLTPAFSVATTAIKREYADALKLMLTATTKGIIAQAHNGYVASSSDLSGRTDLDYKLDTDGQVTVPAADLFKHLDAFASGEDIIIESDGNQLRLTAKDDAERTYYLPTAGKPVVMPASAPSYESEITIGRDYLLTAMDKVLFAVGFQKYRAEFLYWVLRVTDNGFRAVAGDGGRFAVYEVSGAGVCKGTGDLLLFREQTKDLLPKLLQMLDAPEVNFKVFNKDKSDEDDTVADQIVVEAGNTTLTLIGHDPGTKWVNESKFLVRDNKFKFVTALSDWELAVKGMQATYSEDLKQSHAIHVAKLEFDLAKKVIYVKTEGTQGGTGKVKIRDYWSDSADAPPSIPFPVTSAFVSEVFKHGGKEDRIQIEMIEDLTKPAVVRYYAADAVEHTAKLVKHNQTTKVDEQYTVFFGPRNKK